MATPSPAVLDALVARLTREATVRSRSTLFSEALRRGSLTWRTFLGSVDGNPRVEFFQDDPLAIDPDA